MSNADANRSATLVAQDRTARRRISGASDWWFYPLIALAAGALVLASLGAGAFPKPPTPQRAAATPAGALVFGPAELALGVRVDAAQVAYAPRDFGVVPKAFHLAVKPGASAPDGAAGAQLLLDPVQARALVDVPVQVRLNVKVFRASPAIGVAVRLTNGGGGPWTTAPLAAETESVVMTLPPLQGAPPTALEIRMLADEASLNHGGAFTRIEIAPAK